MRLLALSFMLFSQMVFAQSTPETTSTSKTTEVKKCQMRTVKEESYLGTCPKDWVMVGGRVVHGSNVLAILCAQVETVCE